MGVFELDADTIKKAIEWGDPGTCFSEVRCRDSLLRHLREAFPKRKFEPEFRLGRGRADIFVDLKDWTGFGAKVVIELKYNLRTNAEYHRLVGQIGDYVGVGKAEILVVLCGKTDPSLAALVVERLRTFTENKVFWKAHVVVKPFTARGADGRFVGSASR
jgi:hypothetical protein